MKKDIYIFKRNQLGVSSRAFFKIQQINKKFNLINSKTRVLDLGAAPGGWSEYFMSIGAYVIAVDKEYIDMSKLKKPFSAKYEFLQLSIFDEKINNIKADSIVSDISPKLSGNRTIDNAKMEEIYSRIENLVNIIQPYSLVMKVFETDNNKNLLLRIKKFFKKVFYFKPDSSRSYSREIYLIAFNSS